MIAKNILVILIWATLLLVSGCVKNYAALSVDEITQDISVEDSSFDSSVKVVGPIIREDVHRGMFAGFDVIEARLRGWMDKKTKTEWYQLYVSIKYSGSWRYYKRASLKGGSQPDLEVIKRDVIGCSRYGGCSFYEVVGIKLDKDYLISKKSTGFKVRVTSKSGHKTFVTVPPNYIKAYIHKIGA